MIVTRTLMVAHCCVMKLQNSVRTHEENALRTQGGGNAKLLISGAIVCIAVDTETTSLSTGTSRV